VALANAEAFGEDPAADLVNEGDVLLSLGENEIGGLEEQAVRELLAGTRDGDIVLEFARRFVRASGAELENSSTWFNQDTASRARLMRIHWQRTSNLWTSAGTGTTPSTGTTPEHYSSTRVLYCTQR